MTHHGGLDNDKYRYVPYRYSMFSAVRRREFQVPVAFLLIRNSGARYVLRKSTPVTPRFHGTVSAFDQRAGVYDTLHSCTDK